MTRIFYSFLILLILSACSQEEYIDDTEDEILLTTQDVVIPSTIFTSEKQDSIIAEDEIKLSIKTYLDSYEELSNASEPFQEIINEDKKLNKKELEKFDKINKLTKENDKNFSNYILNNTLPEGFQEESERISQYIIGLNEILSEVGEMVGDVNKDGIPKVNTFLSILGKSDVVNGREQKKIEEFLDKKHIDTKAFEREH